MPPLSRPVRGAATLLLVIGLFVLGALAAAYTQRHTLVEARIARGVVEHELAREAALQMLARAQLLLHAGALDTRCEPQADGLPLAERLSDRAPNGELSARPWPAGEAGMVCDRRADQDWGCSCAQGETPAARLPGDGALRQSAVLQLHHPEPGLMALQAQGCARPSADCRADGATGDDASVRRIAHLAWWPALRQLPRSAAWTLGEVDLGDGLQLVNTDADSGGWALRSAAAVRGTRTGLIGPPGSSADTCLRESDEALRSLDAEALLRGLFGVASSALVRHPALRELDCSQACAPALTQALRGGQRLLRVRGDLVIDRAADWGSPERPLLLVVQGSLQVRAAWRMHGLVVVQGDTEWRNSDAASARLHGALVATGRLQGQAGSQLVYDADLLRRLQQQVGSWLAVPGGHWEQR